MWKLLGGWGGEEKEMNVMQCMLVPLPCFLPLPPLTLELGLKGDGLEWGLGPCCNDALTVFCCIPQPPPLRACQVIHLQCPIGPSALHGGKCFIWLFHSWVDRGMERYTICQRPQLLKAL